MKKIRELISTILISLSKRNLLKIKDKSYLKIIYRLKFNKKLNLENPQTFNEKLQWLKLNDRKQEYITMVDKHLCKEYVSNIIGEEYIIPTLGVYKSFSEINFNELPDQFVIKCTHDSGGNVICDDKSKLDIEEARKKITKCLKTNYYYAGREWPYKNVEPKIIIEKYMIDDKINELRDYKFFCFNGEVQVFKIDFDRFIKHGANYYNKKGEILPFEETAYPSNRNKNIIFPKNLNKMIELAEKLSKNIPFIRVDFYEINNQVYFGELTFYPTSGFGEINPIEWDYKLGEYLELPKGE